MWLHLSGGRHNHHVVSHVTDGESAIMKIQTNRYVTSEEEAVSWARRTNRELYAGDET